MRLVFQFPASIAPVGVGRPITASSGSILAGQSFMLKVTQTQHLDRRSAPEGLRDRSRLRSEPDSDRNDADHMLDTLAVAQPFDADRESRNQTHRWMVGTVIATATLTVGILRFIG